MSDKNDYTPIACSLHSEYELAIMRRSKVKLQWKENDQILDETVLPVDLTTHNKVEYLIIKTGVGKAREIRLDKIIRFETVK